MEVKSVYMDLVEGKKKGNVWKLESEAFKKPIEIKICYDNQELAQFSSRFSDLESLAELNKQKFMQLQKEDLNQDEEIDELRREIEGQKDTNIFLGEEIQKNKSELKELYKAIADAKTTIETLSWTIIHLQEQMKLLEKKTAKQPMVFHDKQFISWRESSWLRVCDIPDGEYLMLLNTKVWEHNEYVENEDGLIIEKVHVSWNYVPFYKLVWGTELDTPTATIYYDLVFIPL